MKKKFITALGLFLALVFALNPVLNVSSSEWASKSLAELKKERDNINAKVSNLQGDIDYTQAEMFNIQLEINDLDIRLTEAYDDLQTISDTLDGTVVRFEQAEAELEDAQSDRDEQFESFKERLRVMHEYGEVNFIDVLFQAASIRDFLARLQYLNDVAAHDQKMVERMTEAEDTVSAKVEDIATQRETVRSLQLKQEEVAKTFETTLDEKNKYMSALEVNLETYEASMEAERETQEQINAIYNQRYQEEEERKERERLAALARDQARRAELIASFDGSMGWPAPGFKSISSHYGSRTHPITGRKDFHAAVDLASNSGNDILAAADGVVISSGYQGSYGNCVIVDHGDGFSTLYAHASRLLVSVGDSVTRGQVIAKIGSTGSSTGPHLHFEVRAGGERVDPQPFLGY